MLNKLKNIKNKEKRKNCLNKKKIDLSSFNK